MFRTMLVQSSVNTLGDGLRSAWMGVYEVVPAIVAAVLVFVLGWIVGSVLGRVLSQALHSLKIDRALESTGIRHVLDRGGIHLNTGAFFGGLLKWFVIIVFLRASLDIVNLTQVNDFLLDVLNYLPNVFIAAFVLIVASMVAHAVQRLVVSSAKAANVPSAGVFGTVAKWAIIVLAVLTALHHLNVARDFIGVLFTGLVAMLALAGGLAFGLGGKEAAADFIRRVRSEMGNRD